MAQTPALMFKDGDVIDYTPVSAVIAGQVVEIGTTPLVATSAIAAGALGALACEGIFQVPKTSDAFTAGDAVYWNNAGNPVTGTAGSGAADAATGNLMGWATEDAASGDSYVKTILSAIKVSTTVAGSVTADDITGSDSSLGISGLSAAQGGAIAVLGGPSSTAGNAGGAVTVTGGVPGVTGVGGAVTVAGGAGGRRAARAERWLSRAVPGRPETRTAGRCPCEAATLTGRAPTGLSRSAIATRRPSRSA